MLLLQYSGKILDETQIRDAQVPLNIKIFFLILLSLLVSIAVKVRISSYMPCFYSLTVKTCCRVWKHVFYGSSVSSKLDNTDFYHQSV